MSAAGAFFRIPRCFAQALGAGHKFCMTAMNLFRVFGCVNTAGHSHAQIDQATDQQAPAYAFEDHNPGLIWRIRWPECVKIPMRFYLCLHNNAHNKARQARQGSQYQLYFLFHTILPLFYFLV